MIIKLFFYRCKAFTKDLLTTIYYPGLQHNISVEKIHTNSKWFIIEYNDKIRVACGGDELISIVSIGYETKN